MTDVYESKCQPGNFPGFGSLEIAVRIGNRWLSPTLLNHFADKVSRRRDQENIASLASWDWGRFRNQCNQATP
jgi:hypothetical protein